MTRRFKVVRTAPNDQLFTKDGNWWVRHKRGETRLPTGDTCPREMALKRAVRAGFVVDDTGGVSHD